VLAGRLLAGAAVVGTVVVELELELELLLQPAAASAAATTAAKPILLSLRTVVPPGWVVHVDLSATWMNSLRKDLAFSIRQLFCKQFKVTIA
jgi:hypothetical protein